MRESKTIPQPTWISLMDYAMKNGVSLSTLRRHIKANKVTHKIENGRYLLWDGQHELPHEQKGVPEDKNAELMTLEKKLQRAQEEIAELKTLIAFYEEKVSHPHLGN